jgi:hypothetical protein
VNFWLVDLLTMISRVFGVCCYCNSSHLSEKRKKVYITTFFLGITTKEKNK